MAIRRPLCFDMNKIMLGEQLILNVGISFVIIWRFLIEDWLYIQSLIRDHQLKGAGDAVEQGDEGEDPEACLESSVGHNNRCINTK
nr:hypothetical protein [Tanacetum cinerariifolium]